MPWTASARRQYARPAARYATDLTDDEFALLAPHLPTPSRVGRPREVDLREVLDAILYLLRTGCPWHLLPKSFPAKSTAPSSATSGACGRTARGRRSTPC